MTKPTTRRPAAASARRSGSVPVWAKAFLAELAQTSNVSAAARAVGFNKSMVYAARRGSPEFSRMWNEALCEGYDLLELELLQRLREGEVKLARDARRGVRSFDNATALRLLVAHRQSVARQRALRDSEDTDAILASINARLEGIKRRRAAPPAATTPEREAE